MRSPRAIDPTRRASRRPKRSTSSSTSAAPGTSTARCSTCSWRRRFTSRRQPSAPQQKTDAAPCDDGPERDERSQDLSNPAQTLHVLSSPSQKKRARSTTVKQCVRDSVRAHTNLLLQPRGFSGCDFLTAPSCATFERRLYRCTDQTSHRGAIPVGARGARRSLPPKKIRSREAAR